MESRHQRRYRGPRARHAGYGAGHRGLLQRVFRAAWGTRRGFEGAGGNGGPARAFDGRCRGAAPGAAVRRVRAGSGAGHAVQDGGRHAARGDRGHGASRDGRQRGRPRGQDRHRATRPGTAARLVRRIRSVRWHAAAAAGLCGDRGKRRLRRTHRGAHRARIDGGGQKLGIAMNITEYLEKWGRTLFENPLARSAPSDSPPELAEIRFAVLEEVHRNSYRAGARMVFPFDLVRVGMRGVEESRAAAFSSGFFRSYLEHEIQGKLRADSVRFPERLRVEVEVATGLPLPNEAWLTVVAASPEQPAGSGKPARLVVRQGSANAAELPIEKARVHVGREVDVYRNGGMARRNDLAF